MASSDAPPPPISATSSTPTSWSSILEKQWNSSTPHLYLLVTTFNSTIPGGVETLLKNRQNNAISTTSSSAPISAGTSNNVNPGINSNTALESFDTPINSSTQPPSTLRPPPRNHWKNMTNGIMQKVQKQKESLERQMHTMAIKADGGKNPDWKWVSLSKLSDGIWEEVCTTESMPIRAHEAEIPYAIPLMIEKGWLENGANLKLRIRLKSGAPLLGNKIYDLGSALIDGRRILQHDTDPSRKMTIEQSLDGHILTNAKIQFQILPDIRWPRYPHQGWSLTDPLPSATTSYSFFPPTCQVYNKPPLIAVERAVESTVVLPISTASTRLLVEAAQISIGHVDSVRRLIRRKSMAFEDGFEAVDNNCGDGSVQVFYLQKFPPERAWGRVFVGVHYLPHLSVFEQELGMGEVPIANQGTNPGGSVASMSLPFYIPLEHKLGRLRFEVHLEASHSMGLGMEVSTTVPPQEAVVEGFLNVEIDKNEMTNVTLFDKLGQPIGILVVQSQIQGIDLQQNGNRSGAIKSAQGGLPDLLGMDPLTDASPLDATGPLPTDIRSRQLATMGPFYTPEWMTSHAALRQSSLAILQQRFSTYHTHLTLPNPEPKSNLRKLPSPCRPSSSKSEEMLSGIPFNVHVQSLVLQKKDDASQDEMGIVTNVTCGAPSDHARGFGPKGPAGSGGLRRLELQRAELSKRLKHAKSTLIGNVGDYMRRNAKKHIPVTSTYLRGLRNGVVDLEQKLTAATWEIALRRGNCLCQAMGVGLTSYLSNVTQKEKECFAEQWKDHGYLICYEGMLSTAGKEMGMIEDAATTLEMMGRVGVRMLPSDAQMQVQEMQRVIKVVGSDYLEWISMERHCDQQNPNCKILIQVGVKKSYFETVTPAPLRYNIIQFKPILFQMGVDIRQWGANTTSNLKNQVFESNKKMNKMSNSEDDDLEPPRSEDFDLLTKINYEAFRKLNAYAHAVAKTIQHGNTTVETEAAPSSNIAEVEGVGVIHPHLKNLWDDIKDSAGKMQHGVLDQAAKSTAKLGGGHVVYCKSGKDRTAMQVTFKQAQFLCRFMIPQDNAVIFADATMMRIYGTRLAICEKNVGQPKYAFNALQAKFMPDMLKPPASVLAGFLKGGKVFSKEGFVES